MRLQSIETFYWLARLGKFHLVAERLNTSQPAISARIKSLEQDLGVALFDRSSRTAKLNAHGQRLLPYAEGLMTSVNRIKVGFVETKWIAQTVRIGVSDVIASTWFLDFMKVISKTFSGIRVEMVCDTSARLTTMLDAYEIDIGFVLGPLSAPNVKQRLISSYPLVWVKSPTYATPEGVLSPKDLRKETIVTYPRDTLVHQQVVAYLSEENLPDARIHSVSTSAVILSMVQSGWCVATLPAPIAQPHLDRGELAELKCGFDFDPLVYVATYLKSPWSNLHEQLIDLAEQVVGKVETLDR